ncbi:hypothetical protein PILCRDRAFT_84711 [Piloderma croceum F 1598]|uniref:RRM domain-containing protein n=1 Tax=Piloderma croceum (strain F 1598) TaxID=765440 RepID=A0A0C3GDU7_PILCF|nr:hypothetical protein PILCRDRAFT_84711 [Piloderma croceum F 1598]
MASIFANALRTQVRLALVIRADSDYSEVNRSYTEPNETVYLGNLPFSIGEHELTELLSDFGKIKAVRMGIRPDGGFKGFAHVEFADLASAIKAYEAHSDEPLYMVGRAIRLNYAPKREASDTPPYHKLYISDFPKDEQALRKAFASYVDKITDVHMLIDKATGDILNNGFIEFDSIESATEALNELNGRELEYGIKLNLAYARPKREPSFKSHGSDWRGGQSNSYGASRGGGYQRGGGGGGGGRGGYRGGGGGGGSYGGGGGSYGGGGGSYGGGRGGDNGGGGYRGRSGY